MLKTAIAALGLFLSASLGVAQHWEFEQVDTGGMGAGLHMRRGPGGLLNLAYYHESSGQIRLAVWDTVWKFDDPTIPAVHGSDPRSLSFDVSARQERGVAYTVAGSAIAFAHCSDSLWEFELTGDTGYGPCLSYDTAGVPNLAYGWTSLFHVERSESGWVQTTIAQGGGQWNHAYSCWQLVTDGRGRLQAFCDDYWSFPSSPGDVYGSNIFVVVRTDTGWTGRNVAGGTTIGFRTLALALRNDDSAFVGYYQTAYDPGFYLNGSRIDSNATSARLAVDTYDYAHIAYVSGAFRYRYLDEHGWRFSTILPDANIIVGDVVHDSTGQPIVAYHVRGNGVWLARGVDIVGVGEERSERGGERNAVATILRGLPSAGVVFDVMGKRVESPRAGVYFVREPSAVSGQPLAVRKVVVTR